MHFYKALRRAPAALCLLTLTFLLAFTACGKEKDVPSVSQPAESVSAQSAQSEPEAPVPAPVQGKPLVRVMKNSEMLRDGADGFYRVESPRFDNRSYLMFFDYKTLEQRYVCSVSGCTHSDESCGAFLGSPAYPFVLDGMLYCVYPHYPDPALPKEQWVGAVERRNLDASGAQLVVKTESPGMLDDALMQIFTDGDALYTRYGEQREYIARIDLASGAITTMPWNEQNGIIADNYGRSLVSVCYEGQGTPGFAASLYLTNVDDGTCTKVHTWPDGVFGFLTETLLDGKLYYVNLTTRELVAYDLATNTEATVSTAFTQYGAPYERDWEAIAREPADVEILQALEPVTYPARTWRAGLADGFLFLTRKDDETETQYMSACNLQTGEMTDVSMTLYANAQERPLPIHAATPGGLLVTEEMRSLTVRTIGEDGTPYTFDTSYEVFALIPTADLVSSTPNFSTLQPVEYGAR